MLANQGAGAGGEIQLTDAMATLMESQAFHALEYVGVTHGAAATRSVCCAPMSPWRSSGPIWPMRRGPPWRPLLA